MRKIAVVGDIDSIMGFKAAGHLTFAVKNGKEAGEMLEKLADEDYAIVFITENVIEGAGDILDSYRERLVPAIIPIPGNSGSTGIGMRRVKKAVERAIGADILKQD
jgi:V/A-type H+-transporting ATPase subunit F